MATIHIPPPTPSQIALEFAEKLAADFSVKVTVRIDRASGEFHELSIDRRIPQILPLEKS